MITSRGLNHLNLNVRDVRRSLKFYQEALGLEVRFWQGEKMVFLGSPGGHDIITLSEAEPGEPIGNAGVSHFGFAMAPSDESVEQVRRAGGKLLSRGEHAPGVPFAFFEDPDGYVIEIG